MVWYGYGTVLYVCVNTFNDSTLPFVFFRIHTQRRSPWNWWVIFENHQSRVDCSRSLFDWVEDTKLVWKLTLQLWPLVHPSALWQKMFEFSLAWFRRIPHLSKFLFGMAGNHHKHEWTIRFFGLVAPGNQTPDWSPNHVIFVWDEWNQPALWGMGFVLVGVVVGVHNQMNSFTVVVLSLVSGFTAAWFFLEKPHSWEKDLERRMPSRGNVTDDSPEEFQARISNPTGKKNRSEMPFLVLYAWIYMVL